MVFKNHYIVIMQELKVLSHKMNLFGSLIVLYFILKTGNSNILHSKYNIVKSVLGFFRSRSVVLIYNDAGENLGTKDMATFLKLQKILTFNNFYYTSLASLTTLSEDLTKIHRGVRETVVGLEFNESFVQHLPKASNETVMTSYKWFLTLDSTSQNLNELTIPASCEFLIAVGNPIDGYEVTETYNVDRKRKVTKSLGRLTVGDQYHLNASTDFFNRRKNFQGGVIKVISPKKDACLDMSFSTGVAVIVWCIHQKVWEVIAEMLNATTEITVVPDLTPDVIKNADADVSFRSALFNVIDMDTRSYLWPVFRVKIVVVTSYIRQQVEWRTYILPFSNEMWGVILIWIILCDLILTLFELIAKGWKNENFFSMYSSEFSFVTAFTVCSQGVLGPSKFTGIRIIFVMMFVVPAVLFPGYSAVLTSFLTVQLHKQPFQSLEELSRSKEYKIGWHNTLALRHMFNVNDKSPVNQALLHNNVLPQDKLPTTDAESIERICKEKFVFLTIEDTVLALKPKCSYYMLKQHFKVVFASIETKKDSWYKYFMDRCGRSLAFTGTLYRMKLHVVMKYIKYDEAPSIETRELPPIKMENIVLPFAVLLLGAITSVFLLLLEVLYFKLIAKERKLQFKL